MTTNDIHDSFILPQFTKLRNHFNLFDDVTSVIESPSKEEPIYAEENKVIYELEKDVNENGLKNYITESVDNYVNEKEQFYYVLWKNELIGYLEKETYDNTCVPEAENFLNITLDKMQNEGKIWLDRFFNEQWETDRRSVLRGLLATLAYIDYDKISPVGATMALAALSHEDVAVVQCAVQAFEGWGRNFGIRYLRYVHTDYIWLKKYINSVIQNLEGVREHL